MIKKQLRKPLAVLLVMAMVLSMGISAAAQSSTAEAEQRAAETLHSMGLFLGIGNDADGNPIFANENNATRIQGLIMLLRLFGVYEDALESDYPNPFTDVTGAYNSSIVAFAFAHGITTGVTTTTFEPGAEMTAWQYLTFILRAMGYVDGTDFNHRTAWTFTDTLGITNGEFDADNNTMRRGNVAVISLRAMVTPDADGITILEILVTLGVITEDGLEALADALNDLAELEVLNYANLDALEESVERLAENEMIDSDLVTMLEDAIEEARTHEPSAPDTQPQPAPPGAGGGGTTAPPIINVNNLLFMHMADQHGGSAHTITIDGNTYHTFRASGRTAQPLEWNAPADWPLPDEHGAWIAIYGDPDGTATATGWYLFAIDEHNRFVLTPTPQGTGANFQVFNQVRATANGIAMPTPAAPTGVLPVVDGQSLRNLTVNVDTPVVSLLDDRFRDPVEDEYFSIDSIGQLIRAIQLGYFMGIELDIAVAFNPRNANLVTAIFVYF